MKDTTIVFVTFIVSIFIITQIKIISKIRKIKMTNGKITANNSFYALPCDCGDCCYCFCCLGDLSARCVDACFGEKIDETVEKIVDRKSAADERKIEEKKAREQKKYLTKIEQEKIGREERIEKLRASDYTATVEDKNNLLKIVSMHTKTSLSWTRDSTNLPIEEIVLIIENEPDFEIREEYIINKKKIEEIKKICLNCRNPIEPGSEFCPNCGHDLTKK